jgi:NAD(P)-dependent dehydrogenase (short-subunit alcohol dehydrogenase family)
MTSTFLSEDADHMSTNEETWLENQISFRDQAVVVTGGGAGMGRLYALDLAARGASVLVNDIALDASGDSRAHQVAQEIRNVGGTALANTVSVTDPDAADAIVGACIDAFGRLDALISNAGNTQLSSVEETSLDAFEAQLEVHLVGAFRLCQRAFSQMRAQSYGRIVLISSGTGVFGRKWGVGYASAKAGMLGLMRVLSLEGEEDGICVNAVLPVARTGIADRIADPGFRSKRESIGDSPRLMPSFVTPLTVYLASQRCSVTSGVYSSVAGRYARVLVGVGQGWTVAGEVPPTADDVAAHWSDIESSETLTFPSNVWEEVASVQRMTNATG